MRALLRLLVIALLVGSAFAARHLFIRWSSPESLAGCVGTECAGGGLKPPLPTLTPLPQRPVAPSRFPTPTPIVEEVAPPVEVLDARLIIARYGTNLYPSVEAMPDDLRAYYLGQVEAIATFFNVRGEDLLTLLQARDGGLRLQAPEEAVIEGRGVGQLSTRTWNGWANPETSQYLTDQRLIDQYGGLGFDWEMRLLWLAWREGRNDGTALLRSDASPATFENAAAALARYLAYQGLTRDETQAADFEERVAAAMAGLDEAFPLAGVTASVAAGQALPPASPPLRSAYQRLIDGALGARLSEAELVQTVDASLVAAEVAAGRVGAQEGAERLFNETLHGLLARGSAAQAKGGLVPWPFFYDPKAMEVQRAAVENVGRTLPAWELKAIITRSSHDDAIIRTRLATRADARLYTGTRLRLDAGLQRSARGLPVSAQEVSAMIQPLLAHRNLLFLSPRELQELMDGMEYHIRRLPEYQELHGVRFFSSAPLLPMPRVMKAFGSRASYQPGGLHTGIDVRNRRSGGQEPMLYAVEAGTVAHVGPIYCERDGACRGSHAIILDHGNNVYSIYSHNSEAHVQSGQQVQAGQPIGRQGSEGYSRGSHLHFEVHLGAPYTGNWVEPFRGGEFVNPVPWLPTTALGG